VEFLVEGTLEVNGTADSSAVFEAVDGQEGSWVGIVAQAGSTLDLEYATIRHAVRGVDVDSAATASIQYCTFSDNQSRDIRLATSLHGDPPLQDNTVTVGGGSGIELLGTTTTLTGSSASVSGILVSSGSPTITQNTASGFSAGAGLRIEEGSPTVTNNTFQNSKYGIQVVDTGGTTTPNIGADNVLTGNTNGLRCEGTGAKPVVRDNSIYNNTTGILTAYNAVPDLGDPDDAKNSIYSNTSYCIWNRNRSVGITAKGNWFGSCSEPTCTRGPVVILSWLCTDPNTARRPEIGVLAKPGLALHPSPNPRGARGGFVVELGQPAERVVIEIFDVAGRRVRVIRGEDLRAGRHELRWDGRNEAGQPVSSGIYFVRARADGRYETRAKVLVYR
jgi:parallel beta-helix repeat protein